MPQGTARTGKRPRARHRSYRFGFLFRRWRVWVGGAAVLRPARRGERGHGAIALWLWAEGAERQAGRFLPLQPGFAPRLCSRAWRVHAWCGLHAGRYRPRLSGSVCGYPAWCWPVGTGRAHARPAHGQLFPVGRCHGTAGQAALRAWPWRAQPAWGLHEQKPGQPL